MPRGSNFRPLLVSNFVAFRFAFTCKLQVILGPCSLRSPLCRLRGGLECVAHLRSGRWLLLQSGVRVHCRGQRVEGRGYRVEGRGYRVQNRGQKVEQGGGEVPVHGRESTVDGREQWVEGGARRCRGAVCTSLFRCQGGCCESVRRQVAQGRGWRVEGSGQRGKRGGGECLSLSLRARRRQRVEGRE